MSYGTISFTGLNDGRVFNRPDYIQWKDGIHVKEVTKNLIGTLAQQIALIFGYDTITVKSQWFAVAWDDGLTVTPVNAAMYYVQGRLVFNTRFIAHAGNTCGIDAVTGILAHEVGHRLVYLTILSKGEQLSAHENELCADFIAGLVLRLSRRNVEHMKRCYATICRQGSSSHPDGQVRIGSLQHGYTWVDRDPRGVFMRVSEFVGSVQPQDIFKPEVVREMLMNEVVLPMRQR